MTTAFHASTCVNFYDLWFMSQRFSFDGNTLFKSISATFKRRKTEFPEQSLAVFMNAFIQDDLKQAQWRTFVQRADLVDSTPILDHIIEVLSRFLSLPLEATAAHRALPLCWKPGGPWDKAAK